MIAGLLVAFYRLWHGRLHLPGAGWLLRKCAPMLPSLRDYPLKLAGLGTARLDFRDGGGFYLLNWSLGELGDESQLLAFMATALRPGAVLYDVGANVGLVAAHFAQEKFKLSRIIAFEPNPPALKSLGSLFAAHPKVTVIPCGLGDADMTAQLSTPVGVSYLGSFTRTSERGNQVMVQVRRGDAVAREAPLPPPDVIKIDVEGFEPKVLAGFQETISRHRPVIFFEHIWLTEHQVQTMALPGYELIFIGDDGTLFHSMERRRLGHDAILVPKERLDLFPATT